MTIDKDLLKTAADETQETIVLADKHKWGFIMVAFAVAIGIIAWRTNWNSVYDRLTISEKEKQEKLEKQHIIDEQNKAGIYHIEAE